MAEDHAFRKLDASAQAEARRIAVGMVKSGYTRIEAAAAVGVNRRFVGAWVKAEKLGGAAALIGGKRGRLPGEQKGLQYDEETKIRKLIADRCPDQLKLPFALWTRQAVRELIERKTCKRLSLSSIGRYLRAWGFTAQRPIRRATERSETDVQAWINDEYPGIAARAKAEKCEIQWADETGLSNQANYGKSFAPKGQTPVIPRPAERFS
jgi:transposase